MTRREGGGHIIVQADQAVRQIERAQGRLWVGRQIVIEIRAGQGDDERPIRIPRLEARDRRRAAPGVKRQHHVDVGVVRVGC
ncbi:MULTISPECIES: hypothetical protein [unclassified Methylobacterium]|uniref:hypothetical protein n=1 Tax=unclassified Methylobacterium TaxID=2615210 RepID=UPI0018FE8893|nr:MULTISPECIES: hypothetical protein [unclassified Methylobacterium]